MNNKTVTIAKNLKYKTNDLLEYYNKKQVIIFKYKTVYQLIYSRNIGFYTLEIKSLKRCKKDMAYIRRGRHVFFTSGEANSLLKKDFFI